MAVHKWNELKKAKYVKNPQHLRALERRAKEELEADEKRGPGRPSRGLSEVQVQIRAEAALVDAVKAAAKEQQLSVSELWREAARHFIGMFDFELRMATNFDPKHITEKDWLEGERLARGELKSSGRQVTRLERLIDVNRGPIVRAYGAPLR